MGVSRVSAMVPMTLATAHGGAPGIAAAAEDERDICGMAAVEGQGANLRTSCKKALPIATRRLRAARWQTKKVVMNVITRLFFF